MPENPSRRASPGDILYYLFAAIELWFRVLLDQVVGNGSIRGQRGWVIGGITRDRIRSQALQSLSAAILMTWFVEQLAQLSGLAYF